MANGLEAATSECLAGMASDIAGAPVTKTRVYDVLSLLTLNNDIEILEVFFKPSSRLMSGLQSSFIRSQGDIRLGAARDRQAEEGRTLSWNVTR